MFTVQGEDGKEYGPVSEKKVLAWIYERRLKADSRIRCEKEEWVRLGELPEFNDAFKSIPFLHSKHIGWLILGALVALPILIFILLILLAFSRFIVAFGI